MNENLINNIKKAIEGYSIYCLSDNKKTPVYYSYNYSCDYTIVFVVFFNEEAYKIYFPAINMTKLQIQKHILGTIRLNK